MYVGFIHKCSPVWGGVVCLPRVPALALLRRVFPPIVIIMVAVSLVRVRKRARVTTSIVALIHTHIHARTHNPPLPGLIVVTKPDRPTDEGDYWNRSLSHSLSLTHTFC